MSCCKNQAFDAKYQKIDKYYWKRIANSPVVTTGGENACSQCIYVMRIVYSWQRYKLECDHKYVNVWQLNTWDQNDIVRKTNYFVLCSHRSAYIYFFLFLLGSTYILLMLCISSLFDNSVILVNHCMITKHWREFERKCQITGHALAQTFGNLLQS